MSRVCVGVLVARSLENVLRLFYHVLGAQRVSHLHLSVLKDLLFKIADLALLIAACRLLNLAQRAVILVT